MTLLIRGFCLGFVIAFLTGCSSTQFGFSDTQWEKLSLQQREKLLKDYRRIQREKEAESKKVKITPKTPHVKVTVSGGKAMMPPFDKRFSFKSASMVVYKGQCQTMSLVRKNGSKSIDLEACYHNNELLIDPSRYDYASRYGTVRFYQTPLWERGFTYNGITTQGYTRLLDSKITVKAAHQ